MKYILATAIFIGAIMALILFMWLSGKIVNKFDLLGLGKCRQGFIDDISSGSLVFLILLGFILTLILIGLIIFEIGNNFICI